MLDEPADGPGSEPDADAVGPRTRVRWNEVAVVAVGGAVGTGVRAGLLRLAPVGAIGPGLAGTAVATALINMVGAFALGLLLAVGPRRRLRLLLGTGVLGGFTTYSAFTVDVVQAVSSAGVGAAVLLALGPLLLGLVAAAAGTLVGERIGSRS